MTRLCGEEQTLDLIYEAALQPALWGEVMERLISIAGGEASVLTRMDVINGRGAATTARVESGILQSYFAHFAQINPLHLVSDASAYSQGWKPRILLDEDWMSREDLERSEYYNDFLRPISAEWSMMIRLSLSGTDVASIGIGRSYKMGRFEKAETAAITRLQPHLIRAYGLSEKFCSFQALSAGLASGLDQSTSAMILIDKEARILYANRPGECLLAKGDILCAPDGRLNVVDPSCASSFAFMLGRAGTQEWELRCAGSVSLRSPNGSLPLTVTATPVRLEQLSVFSRRSATLVCVTDPYSVAPQHEQLKAYALTAAESRLASALVEGMTLRQASARYGISIKTVRNQLASVFEKTGVQRQVDLVRLLTR